MIMRKERVEGEGERTGGEELSRRASRTTRMRRVLNEEKCDGKGFWAE